ncbi:sulfotransferase family protein [Planctomycetales bacterium]|nr:sulfotransferase family protein [Planctomycetales bacterium]
MSSPLTKKEVGGYTDRFWYPRFSDGMAFSAWLRLLKAGKFRIAPIRFAMAVIISSLAICVNSPSAILQRWFYGRKIRETQLAGAPIFIIGHWRSGTTLLHEYLVHDEQFSFADTFACFVPAHFVINRYGLRQLVAVLMPKKRPVDNMAAGFDRPQEDEFALMSLGLPSPYRNIIFPNNGLNIDTDYLTLRNVSGKDRKTWLDGLETFLKALTFLNPGKRIVLKSPPHTGRIKAILERFPDAKFVHIHRNPYSIFPSTYNLWMRLAKDEGVQCPKGDGMEDYVFNSLNTMYDAFEEDVGLLKPNQFCEIAYKDLTAAPVETLERIYNVLELNHFDEVRLALSDYAATQKSYKKNQFSMEPETKAKIAAKWKRYFERYGYEI